MYKQSRRNTLRPKDGEAGEKNNCSLILTHTPIIHPSENCKITPPYPPKVAHGDGMMEPLKKGDGYTLT